MAELRIIITGDMDFKNYQLLSDTIMDYLEDMDFVDPPIVDDPSQVIFISGGRRGAEVLGEQFAYKYEYNVVRFSTLDDLKTCEKMAEYASEKDNHGVMFVFTNGKDFSNQINIGIKYGLDVHII